MQLPGITLSPNGIRCIDVIMKGYLNYLARTVSTKSPKKAKKKGLSLEDRKRVSEQLHKRILNLLLLSEQELEGRAFPLTVDEVQVLLFAMKTFTHLTRENIPSTSEWEKMLTEVEAFCQELEIMLLPFRERSG